jgi:hypothetical protein
MTDPPPAFTCPICGLNSWHPKDGEEQFCSRCDKFVEDIIYGRRLPMESAYLAGRRAHSAGEPFSNWPPPFGGPEALSWRFGWNDHALGRLSMFPETPS